MNHPETVNSLQGKELGATSSSSENTLKQREMPWFLTEGDCGYEGRTFESCQPQKSECHSFAIFEDGQEGSSFLPRLRLYVVFILALVLYSKWGIWDGSGTKPI